MQWMNKQTIQHVRNIIKFVLVCTFFYISSATSITWWPTQYMCLFEWVQKCMFQGWISSHSIFLLASGLTLLLLCFWYVFVIPCLLCNLIGLLLWVPPPLMDSQISNKKFVQHCLTSHLLLVTYYWSLTTGHLLLAFYYWSLTTGLLLLVTDYWSFTTGHLLLVTYYWSLMFLPSSLCTRE